jgi:hypothetical protein
VMPKCRARQDGCVGCAHRLSVVVVSVMSGSFPRGQSIASGKPVVPDPGDVVFEGRNDPLADLRVTGGCSTSRSPRSPTQPACVHAGVDRDAR